MHAEVEVFYSALKSKLPRYFESVSVLEIGSYNVNGSLRSYFSDSRWTGVDLVPGPGVDIVSSGHEFRSDEKFDHALSSECFEHNPFFAETFARMVEQTKPSGLVSFTCAAPGRPEHGTARTSIQDSPGNVVTDQNYYRNLTSTDFDADFLKKHFSEYLFFLDDIHCDLMFVGQKKGEAGLLTRDNWASLKQEVERAISDRHFKQLFDEQVGLVKRVISLDMMLHQVIDLHAEANRNLSDLSAMVNRLIETENKTRSQLKLYFFLAKVILAPFKIIKKAVLKPAGA